MQRASPVDLRKCLRAANMLAQAGVRFVPVPAVTDEEFAQLSALMDQRLDAIATAAEKEEQQNVKDR
ncbi:TPA: DUF1382 family protein [Enterobacter hormaechei]|nr:DUF1382 family protein [Enterobacter hormaechei]HED5802426.1 DUF1382 family protein [Enterobacter hormaechei]HED5821853.1 DUF1382 family protein [Enterobacter hormaechei]